MSREGTGRTLLIVDRRPLRRALLAHFLEDLASKNGLTIVQHEGGEVPRDELSCCALVIFSVGSRGLGSQPLQEAYRSLPAGESRLPFVIVAEESDVEEARRALEMGASAYIPMSTLEDVFLLALHSVLSNGSFFPLHLLRKIVSQAPMIGPEREDGQLRNRDRLNGTCSMPNRRLAPPTPQAPPAGREHSVPNLALGENLTSRQSQVLEGLRRAWSNKEIARALNMSEATVKVHVRQVMRKLGASNRTHAVILTTPNGAPGYLGEPYRNHSVIPARIDQNSSAQERWPMELILQGWSMSSFHASQQWATMSS